MFGKSGLGTRSEINTVWLYETTTKGQFLFVKCNKDTNYYLNHNFLYWSRFPRPSCSICCPLLLKEYRFCKRVWGFYSFFIFSHLLFNIYFYFFIGWGGGWYLWYPWRRRQPSFTWRGPFLGGSRGWALWATVESSK